MILGTHRPPESGDGNIDVDPVFVDDDGIDNVIGTPDDNLRLDSTTPSPCLNEGDQTLLPASVCGLAATLGFDLDMNDRVADGEVDMGAYEDPDP